MSKHKTKKNEGSSKDERAKKFYSLVEEMFPEACSEGNIDFDTLIEAIGGTPQSDPEEYCFTWAGKTAARKEAEAPPAGTVLRFLREESSEPDTTGSTSLAGAEGVEKEGNTSARFISVR